VLDIILYVARDGLLVVNRFGTKLHITVEQFVEFLNSYQRDPRLNEILYPYANPDRARDLFQQYEPNAPNAPKGNVTINSMKEDCSE
jgi:hypothetical protein